MKAKLLADTPLNKLDRPQAPERRREMTEYERLALAGLREWKSPLTGSLNPDSLQP